MRLLVDTHIILWWDRQLRRVPADLRAAIEDPGNIVFVSAASVWEIAIKGAVGKLAFAAPIIETVARLVPGINETRYTPSGVIAGPAEGRVPAIHVDARDKPGHDEQEKRES